MPVKENQPALRASLVQIFANVNANARWLRSQRVQSLGDRTRWPVAQDAVTREVGHGRIEQRTLKLVSLAELAPGWVE